MPIARKDLPSFVRHCYDRARKSNMRNREAQRLRLKAYVGDMWLEEEKASRRNTDRPYLVENRCKPAVDQIEGDVRINPPGPKVLPVGTGPDSADPDIMEGLIREVEYRSHAETAYATAIKYSAAGGEAYIELETEWTDDRSFNQRLVIKSVEDPSVVFFDTEARMANRQDARWAGKLRKYSKEEYEDLFGKKRVLQDSWVQNAKGWIADAMGGDSNMSGVNEWTGSGKGPFYVSEFYLVEEHRVKLRMYDNGVCYYDDEEKPDEAEPRKGDEWVREVPRRKIRKYVVDAFEVLDDTEWMGRLIPLFPVLGPEVYIDGELHRLSLISGAIDSNRGLNYVVSTTTEIVGVMSRAPWIGAKGQFEDPAWRTANKELHPYLEYTPVHAVDENGTQVLLPPPQRNMYEASIQWLVMLAGYFRDAIKGVTSIYDPSLGQQKSDQSGKAIEQLRSESSVGNFSYADNLHRAIEIIYDEMCYIFPKIYDGPTVVTIVKADSEHETAEINQIFTEGEQGERGEGKKANTITFGEYSARVTVGPNEPTRLMREMDVLLQYLKAVPQAAAIPAFSAQLLRVIAQGDPKIEALADMIAPQDSTQVNPQQFQALQAKNQQLMQVLQQAHMEKLAKLPELEERKWEKAIDALTKLRVAEITASKDTDNQNADREAASMEHVLGMAHETALAHSQQAHQQSLQESQQQAAAQGQATDQAHQMSMAEQAQQAAQQQQEQAQETNQ